MYFVLLSAKINNLFRSRGQRITSICEDFGDLALKGGGRESLCLPRCSGHNTVLVMLPLPNGLTVT